MTATKSPKEPDFFSRIQTITENFLTHCRRKRRLKRQKQAQKHFLIDWLEAFIWAAGVVLLINQYFMQGYVIPSGSMIDTLLIKDRIFVNKFIYGPELLPNFGKIPSPVTPQRNDIIIFESPSYLSRGTAFDIAQRIIYMLTLSFVDIDKDERGQPKPHFLIKRAAGMSGDRIFNKEGDLYFQFPGEDRIVAEQTYLDQRGWNHMIRRLAGKEAYPALTAAAKQDVWMRLGLASPTSLDSAQAAEIPRRVETISYETAWYNILRQAYPNEVRFARQYYRKALGWYVPETRILPLGDNRDSSYDGRFFGAIRVRKVLGQGLFIYWPGINTDGDEEQPQPLKVPPARQGFSRIGIIR